MTNIYNMWRGVAVAALLAGGAGSAVAVAPGEVRFRHEATDTVRITQLLVETYDEGRNAPSAQRIASIAEKLVGTPYAPGTIEGTPEQLTVDMEEMDCTTFVETVLAMAMTLDERRTSWHDFIYNLERLRYRNGRVDGYGSRLHYVSDWAIDNNHRGILQEVTDRLGSGEAYQVKTLDFMSSHRDKYPALEDDAEFEKLKNAEIGYRSHRFPYIKPMGIKGAQLRSGDVVAITTKTPGLDVQHMGIVVMKDGVAHLVHASSKAGKVVVDELPLTEYVRRNRTATGIRVFRLKD